MTEVRPPLHQELLTLAEERLDAGVEIFLECYANSEWSSGPSYAALHLDRSGFARLTHAMKCCVENDWYMIETNDKPSRWDDEDRYGLSVRFWSLRVSKEHFWLYGTPKDGNDTVESRVVDIARLVKALNSSADPANQTMPEHFAWFGGVLIFGTSDVQSLCDMVAEACPDIEATENSLEMNRVIGLAPQSRDPAEAPVNLPRRHSV